MSKKKKIVLSVLLAIVIVFLLISAAWGIYCFKTWKPVKDAFIRNGASYSELGKTYHYKGTEITAAAFRPGFLKKVQNMQFEMVPTVTDEEHLFVTLLVYPNFNGKYDYNVSISETIGYNVITSDMSCFINPKTLEPLDSLKGDEPDFVACKEEMRTLVDFAQEFLAEGKAE